MGNTAIHIQEISVTDSDEPVFEPWPNQIEVGTDAQFAIDPYDIPTATDIFKVTVTCDPMPYSEFPIGATRVTCKAMDENYRESSIRFNVVVTSTSSDTVIPEITAPLDLTFEARGPFTPINIGTATATDNSGVAPAISHNAPAAYPIGDTPVVWTATDGAGNSADATQIITIRDTTAPVFTITPENIRTMTDENSKSVSYDTPMTTDIFRVTTECTPPSSSTFGIGTTTVTCIATDQSGNTASISFTVTVGSDSSQHRILAVRDEGETFRYYGISYMGEYRQYRYDMAVNTLQPGFIILMSGSDVFTLQAQDSEGAMSTIPFSYHDAPTRFGDVDDYVYIELDQPLLAGTYTLLAGQTELGTITLGRNVVYPEQEITMMAVSSNGNFVQFYDGITITKDSRIHFRGTIHGFDGITLLVVNSEGASYQIGRSGIFDIGVFGKSTRNIPNDTYTISANGIDLGTITVVGEVNTNSGVSGTSGASGASNYASTNSTASEYSGSNGQ